MKLDLSAFKVKKPKDKNFDITDAQAYERLIKLHDGKTLAERKYDGHGILIDNRLYPKIYSLAKTPWKPECIPEILDDLHRLPKGFYVGELVGRPTNGHFGNKQEFDAISSRCMTGSVEKAHLLAEEKPLEIRLYHILEQESKLLATQPLTEMRKRLEEIALDFILPVEQCIVSSAEELYTYATDQFDNDKEGLVIKRGSAPYCHPKEFVCGSRNDDWIKIKRQITFDFVVLGLYQTKARLAQGWPCSNLLLGTYNEETEMFETISKLTIPSKKLAETFFNKLPETKYTWNESQPYSWQNTNNINKNDIVVYSNAIVKKPSKIPYLFTNPLESFVVEVQAIEITAPRTTIHSCGATSGQAHSLRGPTFVRLREKTALEATSTQQIQSYLSD